MYVENGQSSSIRSGRLDLIDHQHWHRALAGFKLEAELVLNGREQAWRGVGIGFSVQQGSGCIVRRPAESHIIAACQPCLVHDYPALRLGKFAREQAEGVVAALDV